jgi:hypothetical protein
MRAVTPIVTPVIDTKVMIDINPVFLLARKYFLATKDSKDIVI